MIISEWIKCSDTLPPEMQEVETKINDAQGERNLAVLSYHRTQWWTPDFARFVYENPTHWRKALKTNRELFAKHVALGVFVETGTCFGRSVAIALELGYKEIRSVEAKPERHVECLKLFADNPQVRLWCGESQTILPEMISDLVVPAVFWNDAHPSGSDSYNIGEQSKILMTELQIIASHPVKSHVILIDDLSGDIEIFARELFPDADIEVHQTDESDNSKVMEIQCRIKI